MSREPLDRRQVKMRPLAGRINRVKIARDAVPLDAEPHHITEATAAVVEQTAARIMDARAHGKPVVMAFGAHTIKNGLGPLLINLIEHGWVTHLATNGAGVIHDWEFAWLGESSEHVATNAAQGCFGNWEETGRYINLAINIGAYEGLGYGAAVGKMIEEGGLEIPKRRKLISDVLSGMGSEVSWFMNEMKLVDKAISKSCSDKIDLLNLNPNQVTCSAELIEILKVINHKPGRMEIPHPFAQYSLQAAAYRLGVPFTAHPMFGHDIIYNHPLNNGALLGRAAERDWLSFAGAIRDIDGGVYLSVGSAVMSPMIFEKAYSMAQNIALQEDRSIENHTIVVVDLAEGVWDWSQGEPPEEHPAYYQRFNKTFSRMGGKLLTASADNRDFLLALRTELFKSELE